MRRFACDLAGVSCTISCTARRLLAGSLPAARQHCRRRYLWQRFKYRPV